MHTHPRRYGLFTPELQWQSRGKRRILQGGACVPTAGRAVRGSLGGGGACGGGSGALRCVHPFDTGCLPLGYSGNPGVNTVSDSGDTLPFDSAWLPLDHSGNPGVQRRF